MFNLIAIDLICATQAVEFRRPLKSGKGTNAAFKTIRSIIPFWDKDRPLFKDIQKIRELINGSDLIEEVEKAVGKLGNVANKKE